MLGIITTLLPLAVKIINYFIEKNAQDRKLKAAWVQFIESMAKQPNFSIGLRNSYAEQGKRLREKLQAESKKNR